MTDAAALASLLMRLAFFPFQMGGTLGITLLGMMVVAFSFAFVRLLFNRGCC